MRTMRDLLDVLVESRNPNLVESATGWWEGQVQSGYTGVLPWDEIDEVDLKISKILESEFHGTQIVEHAIKPTQWSSYIGPTKCRHMAVTVTSLHEGKKQNSNVYVARDPKDPSNLIRVNA